MKTRGGWGWVALGIVVSDLGCGLLLELPEPVEQESVLGAGDADGGLGGSGVRASAGAASGGGGSGSGGTHVVPEGGNGGEAADGCEEPCDCDGDNYLAKGACGGDDCDDEDEEVHPDQGLYFAARAQSDIVGFDYDCSGAIERDPAQGSAISCAALSLGVCEDAQGFHGTQPPCGLPGAWGACEEVTLSCKAVVLDDSAVARCH